LSPDSFIREPSCNKADKLAWLLEKLKVCGFSLEDLALDKLVWDADVNVEANRSYGYLWPLSFQG
jgi:hypothetical protein